MTTDLGPALAQLKRNLGPPATPGWLAYVAYRCAQLGHLWGGADVLAWWLVQRTRPAPRLNPTARQRLLKECHRSQRALNALVFVHLGKNKPARLSSGWSHLRVSSYLDLRHADLNPAAFNGRR